MRVKASKDKGAVNLFRTTPFYSLSVKTLYITTIKGIGLCIAKSMVELHGGTLGVRSKLNEGTTFTICLTMESAQRDPSVLTDICSEMSFFTKRSSEKLRCLVVDDTSSNRRIMVMMLNHLGAQTSECSDGLECINVYSSLQGSSKEENPYDIIFMDSTMPGMDGSEASTTLRAMGYENMIVGVTGNALEEDKRSFIEAGADVVLSKPTSKEVLAKFLDYVYKFGAKRSQEMRIMLVNENFIRFDSQQIE